MSNTTEIVTRKQQDSSFDGGDHYGPEQVRIGQWCWVSDKAGWRDADDDGKPLKEGAAYKWLGCVMEVGSNYAEVHSPKCGNDYYRAIRVHFDEFEKRLHRAPDAEAYIAAQQRHFQRQINVYLEQIKEITARLGVIPTERIGDKGDEAQNALVVVSMRPDTSAYKKALVKAQDKTLPELFKKVKEANAELIRWMTAPTLTLTATILPMERSIGKVKDRIYTIELYAGLTEDAAQCCKGAPAAIDEKLHVMQRRLYMDEESIANYTAGGMDIHDIKEFDAWLSKPENRDRLLPFPRTLTAFRVRRNTKFREDGDDLTTMFVNFELENADKKTFLYVRNGEQVWRIDCDFEFDEMILPEKNAFNPSEPMMVRLHFGRVEDMMPRKRWESLSAEEDERQQKYAAWESAHPDVHYWENPHRENVHDKRLNEYRPFDPSNVYFDDALKHIADEIKRYNRIAVIVQGLFDRSEVLHPHIPVKMWEPESFNRSVELVYDATTLTYGEKPDFEAYRAKLNASLSADSIVTGQEDFWLRREAERENERRERDWRRNTSGNLTRYRPSGDPGPGLVGQIGVWKPRSRKALFQWERQSRNYRQYPIQMVASSIEVPAGELLNVSAYKPGDFRQFFADPRTRVEYLKWAPLLLVAEDWHAKKTTGFKRSNKREY